MIENQFYYCGITSFAESIILILVGAFLTGIISIAKYFWDLRKKRKNTEAIIFDELVENYKILICFTPEDYSSSEVKENILRKSSNVFEFPINLFSSALESYFLQIDILNSTKVKSILQAYQYIKTHEHQKELISNTLEPQYLKADGHEIPIAINYEDRYEELFNLCEQTAETIKLALECFKEGKQIIKEIDKKRGANWDDR